jgi:glycosyltransferase involved in cell wall biosynthesis
MRLLPLLRRLQRDFDFDWIDAHFGYPEGVAAAWLGSRCGRRFAITLRGSELLHSHWRARRAAMAWALRQASLVVAVSEELRDFAIALGAPPGRTHLSVNGVDTQIFCPRDRREARDKFGIAPGQMAVLSAGHLIPLKRHDAVIRAITELVVKGYDIKLLIAGGPGRGVPDCERELRRLVEQTGLKDRVRFLGAVPPGQMPELMSAADVLCLASTREGSPNVVNEALACGTPVVATAVGSVPSLIPSDEIGIVIGVDQLGGLAATLQQALHKRWDRKAIAEFGSRRSWDSVAIDLLHRMERIDDE